MRRPTKENYAKNRRIFAKLDAEMAKEALEEKTKKNQQKKEEQSKEVN